MIKELIEKFLCRHNWKKIEETIVYHLAHRDITKEEVQKLVPSYRRCLYICQNCGAMKEIKM